MAAEKLVGAPDRKTQKIPFWTRRSSTRGMPRGLFGSIGLITLAVAEFIAHESVLHFGSLNHAQDQEINGQTARLLLEGERT
jgi:hypothetical protein